MKTPNPHFDADAEKYDDFPAEYDTPRLGVDFDDLDGADALDRETVAELSALWTLLCRAWESPRTVLSPPEVAEIVEIYLDREQRLDRDEREKLDMFMAELGTLRSPDRAFEALTGIEYEIMMILQPRARQALSSAAFVSAVLLDDEPADPALDLHPAFERNRLAVVDETDAGGER